MIVFFVFMFFCGVGVMFKVTPQPRNEWVSEWVSAWCDVIFFPGSCSCGPIITVTSYHHYHYHFHHHKTSVVSVWVCVSVWVSEWVRELTSLWEQFWNLLPQLFYHL
jgi:hypothetical protein